MTTVGTRGGQLRTGLGARLRPGSDARLDPAVEPIGTRKQRADGTTLACIYATVLFVLPSHLVVAAIPLALAPSMLIGMGLGLLWFCAQMVNTLGMAKGRSLVRTSLFLFAFGQLATYGYATYGWMPSDELNATDRSVITIMAVAVVGIMVCDAVRGLSRIDKLLRVIVYGATFVAVIGLIQFFFGIDPTHYMVLPGLRAVDDVNTLLERSIFRRPSGTAGHPIEFGVVCAVAAPLAAHYAFRAKDAGQRTWTWWLCLLAVSIGAMVSLSRSAILGLIAAAIILLPSWPVRRRWQTLGVAVVFLGVMRLMIPGLIGTLFSLFNNLSGDPSIQHRTEDYARAEVQIAIHPWLGRGFGTYLPDKYGPLDNQYLGTLVENGIIGLTVLIVLLLAGVYAALRSRMASKDHAVRDLSQTLIACLSVIIVADATYDAFGFIMATGLCFMLVGICGALWRTIRENPDQVMPPIPVRRRRREKPDDTVHRGSGSAAGRRPSGVRAGGKPGAKPGGARAGTGKSGTARAGGARARPVNGRPTKPGTTASTRPASADKRTDQPRRRGSS
jgi:polysaccharide biosynthesis protein PslJ